MTSSYKGIPVQKAGERFGLSADDLEELFSMREEGTSGDEFMPLVQMKTTEKGRGGVMSFKAAKAPTALKTYGALEGQGNVVATGGSIGNIKIGQTATQTQEEKKVPTAPKALTAEDILANFSQYDVGEQGLFGGKDVDYLRGLNVADEEIRKVAAARANVQPLPAAVYERLGGVTPQEQASAGSLPGAQTYAKQFLAGAAGFDAGEAGIFGGQDVDAMRSKGYSDDQIRATARALQNAGQTLPAAVTRRLGYI